MAESYHRSWRVWRSRLKVMGLVSATESYAASVLYTTLASLSGAVWRIRWANLACVAVGCGWQATVRDFYQIGVHQPLTTPAIVIPCNKCKRRPGYLPRRRWRGWRRTARILGGSSSGPALCRPPIRARPARAVFVGDVTPIESGYYHPVRIFQAESMPN